MTNFEIKNNKLVKCVTDEVNITIPNGITSIGDFAFYNCSSIESVVISNTVTEIGECAFRSCTSLKSVKISDSVVIINNGAFEYCSSLVSIIIPDSVIIIGEGVFRGCSNFSFIAIGNSVKKIGNGAFLGCSTFTPIIKGMAFKANKKSFTNDYNEAVKMLQTKDFSVKLYTPLKTVFVVGFYLETGDTAAESFIKRGITRIMKFLIDENNFDAIMDLLETEKFVNAKNIDTFIEYAYEQFNTELEYVFRNYKRNNINCNDKLKCKL